MIKTATGFSLTLSKKPDTEQETLAKQEAQAKAQQAQEKATRLAKKLKELGIDPDDL